MYKVLIDGEEIIVTYKDLDEMDNHSTPVGYHVLEEMKAYHVTIPKVGQNPKTGTIHVNNKRFRFDIMDKYDQLVSSMGLDAISETKVTDILAPMPGLILGIMVKSGDEIEAGCSILILEAMKMENVIKAEGRGVIKSVNFKVGATVDKGAVIIEME
ncbi:MAG: biotin carboxyl carrier protein [Saprospiraceae bacterium]|jgi:biotin carboxyl carrier protein